MVLPGREGGRGGSNNTPGPWPGSAPLCLLQPPCSFRLPSWGEGVAPKQAVSATGIWGPQGTLPPPGASAARRIAHQGHPAPVALHVLHRRGLASWILFAAHLGGHSSPQGEQRRSQRREEVAAPPRPPPFPPTMDDPHSLPPSPEAAPELRLLSTGGSRPFQEGIGLSLCPVLPRFLASPALLGPRAGQSGQGGQGGERTPARARGRRDHPAPATGCRERPLAAVTGVGQGPERPRMRGEHRALHHGVGVGRKEKEALCCRARTVRPGPPPAGREGRSIHGVGEGN